MAARHHWLHAVSVDGEPTAVVILKTLLACAVGAAAQAAAVEAAAAPLLKARLAKRYASDTFVIIVINRILLTFVSAVRARAGLQLCVVFKPE